VNKKRERKEYQFRDFAINWRPKKSKNSVRVGDTEREWVSEREKERERKREREREREREKGWQKVIEIEMECVRIRANAF